ncbi:MAG: hypothetical protein JF597_31725 [Streptomyces sp.]|uniref:WD40 repeat domain-containing protein n=1 Tax=Streptomyces sp. TaxID=1931 RepID=UPI0025E375FB|nr:hypothetical protein [Streptomyces sp.]MBW8797989.1 hypothetical protein [Streptomyces sp.]
MLFTAGASDTPLTALDPDGRLVAACPSGGTPQVWDTATGRVLRTLPPVPVPVSADPHLPVVPQDAKPLLAFSADGTRFAYGVSAPGREAVAQPVTVWDVPHGRPVSSVDLPGDAVLEIALGPADRTLYAARDTSAGVVADEVWDVARGRRASVVTGVAVSDLGVRPDGGLLVGDGRATRLPSGPTYAPDLVQGEEVDALSFAADGSLPAAGDQTGRVARSITAKLPAGE